jgi:hypothetical protein
MGDRSRIAGAVPLARLKKSALARLAEEGATAHELMAISGHKTLTEVRRYTEAAEKLRLADSAMAKKDKKIADVTNTAPHLHKPGAISLKLKGRENQLALPRDSNPCFRRERAVNASIAVYRRQIQRRKHQQYRHICSHLSTGISPRILDPYWTAAGRHASKSP